MDEQTKAAVSKILNDYLKQGNHRKTPERFAILDAICSMEGRFTMDQLMNTLEKDVHFIVSRPTLFNTLRLFQKLRIVTKHSALGEVKYEVVNPNANHSFQICTNCGKTTAIQTPKITEDIEGLHLNRFRKNNYDLYIYGVCSSCVAKMNRKKVLEDKRQEETADGRKTQKTK